MQYLYYSGKVTGESVNGLNGCFIFLQDRRIAVKACEGLMLCSSIPDDHAASVIILYTPFCEVMVCVSCN